MHTDAVAGGVNLGIIVVPMLDMSFQLLSFFIMVYSPNTGEEFITSDLVREKRAAADAVTAVKGPKKDPVISLPTTDKAPKLEENIVVLLTRNDPRFKNVEKADDKVDGKDVEAKRPLFIQLRTPANVLDKGAKEKDAKDKGDAKGASSIIDLPMDELWKKDPPKEAENLEKEALADLEKRLDDLYKELHGAEGDKAKDAIKTKVEIEADRSIRFEYVIKIYALCRRAKFEDVNFTTPHD